MKTLDRILVGLVIVGTTSLGIGCKMQQAPQRLAKLKKPAPTVVDSEDEDSEATPSPKKKKHKAPDIDENESTGTSDPSAATPSKPAGPATPTGPATPGTSPDAGPQTPVNPNGLSYAKAVLPLMNRYCTECHHPGKPLDYTKVPFAAGDMKQMVDKLLATTTTTMPPAPRDKVPAEFATVVQKWAAEGMNP
jgi:hypothetical protein